MFSRLKQKVKDESTSDSPPSIQMNITSARTAKSVSGSDGNQSCGDETVASSTRRPSNSKHIPNKNTETNNTPDEPSRHNTERLLLSEGTLDRYDDIAASDTFSQTISSESKTNKETLTPQAEASHSVMHANETDTAIKNQLKELNQTLLQQVDKLSSELKHKLNENEELQRDLTRLKSKLKDTEIEVQNYKSKMDDYSEAMICSEDEINQLKNEKSELLIKNAELSEKYELLKLVNQKQKHNLLPGVITVDAEQYQLHSSSNARTASISQHEKEDNTHDDDQTITNAQTLTASADKEIKHLRDEVHEKNKLIKNLQQRLNDMKKTLQKELKFQSLPNDKSQNNSSVKIHVTNATESDTFSNSKQQTESSLPETANHANHVGNKNMNKNRSGSYVDASSPIAANREQHGDRKTMMHSLDCSHSSSHTMNMDNVNLKYLKHVILKFVTSREYEALHLIKALSVLLEMTNDEEKVLKETLEWKMSWFGSKPKIAS